MSDKCNATMPQPRLVVPAWHERPTEPGLWLRRQLWKDDLRSYDTDQLREFVMGSDGLMLVGNQGRMFQYDELFGFNDSPAINMWFGPIPPLRRLPDGREVKL